MPYEHLDENRLFAMDLSPEERIALIRNDVIINTEHLMSVTTIVSNMIAITKGSMEAPCLVVTADTNYGKSTICDAIRGMDKSWSRKIRYVTFVKRTDKKQARPKPLHTLMRGLGLEPGKYGIDIDIIVEYCLANDIRAIFMDEFQDSVIGLSAQEQRDFMSTLRGLCGHPVFMSFFAFGVAETINALAFDSQYIRRFEIYDVTAWSHQDAEFLNFLDTWESIAPLALPSKLSSPELSTFIHAKTGGVIGKICELLKAAAAYAISTGTEKITLEMLQLSTKSKWLQKLVEK